MSTPSDSSAFLQDEPSPAIAREGLPIIAWMLAVPAALAAGALYLSTWAAIGVAGVGFVLALWGVWFFRDPSRRIPGREGSIVSPADGVVCFVGAGTPPSELGIAGEACRGMTRVSVFMNVFNVHVNRVPIAGRVVRVAYRAGKFFNASFDKASEHNERCSLALELADGRPLVVVQIAGLIARRIVCRVSEGAVLATGERFGLIRFGSRVDVYLPEGVGARVRVGDRAVAGETVFAVVESQARVIKSEGAREEVGTDVHA